MQRVGKVGGSSRSDTDGFDPSLWTPIRLAGSRIARNLEKQTNYQSNVFAEVRKRRSDTRSVFVNSKPTSHRSHGSADNFIGETQGLLYLHPSLLRSEKKHFRDFHDFTLWWGTPLGTISGAKRDKCRNCGKKLAIDGKVFPVVIYSCQRESCLGSRLTKHCHYCKLYEREWNLWNSPFGSAKSHSEGIATLVIAVQCFQCSAKRLAPHLAEFFLSTVRRSLEFVAFKKFWQRTWNWQFEGDSLLLQRKKSAKNLTTTSAP